MRSHWDNTDIKMLVNIWTIGKFIKAVILYIANIYSILKFRNNYIAMR